MGNKRSQYTKEYKIEEVRLILEEGKINVFSGNGRLSLEGEELPPLRLENKHLRNGEFVMFICALA